MLSECLKQGNYQTTFQDLLRASSGQQSQQQNKKNYQDTFLQTFPTIVEEVYNSTPENDRGLRDLIIKSAVDNLNYLKPGKTKYDAPALRNELMKNIPQFTYDLAVALINLDWE